MGRVGDRSKDPIPKTQKVQWCKGTTAQRYKGKEEQRKKEGVRGRVGEGETDPKTKDKRQKNRAEGELSEAKQETRKIKDCRIAQSFKTPLLPLRIAEQALPEGDPR
jgi:hypothetical protein